MTLEVRDVSKVYGAAAAIFPMSLVAHELDGLGIAMTGPLGFNNTYAIGVKRVVAEKLGIATISDLAKHPELKLGFSNEFMNRADGWPALRSKYDLPHADVTALEHEMAYRAIAEDTIHVTDIYSTDAEISYYDLVALKDEFLYGLLPIVRNTYTGLQDIPAHLVESANALGLSRRERLFKVELPLASRAILAGIKISAVISIGTATLGAIIGAGGYGEPIMMGIRRYDINLILEGAIPAAVLALVVQGMFELAERRVVPLGLRLKPLA